MSRHTHQVEVTPEQLRTALRRACIVAVVLWVGFFTIFVALVPAAPKADPNATMAAAVTP